MKWIIIFLLAFAVSKSIDKIIIDKLTDKPQITDESFSYSLLSLVTEAEQEEKSKGGQIKRNILKRLKF